MRRILISKDGEFNYQATRSNTLGMAIRRLATFFDGLDGAKKSNEDVAISNSIQKTENNKTRNEVRVQ
jgi:hypothetical protein